MNSKLFLVATLACLYVVPAYATVDLIFGANAIGIGTAAGLTGTTTTISGGALLLGALGATVGKALLLREATRVSESLENLIHESSEFLLTIVPQIIKIQLYFLFQGRGGSRRSSYRSSRRGKREALPVFTDEEGVRFITDLLREYEVAYAQ